MLAASTPHSARRLLAGPSSYHLGVCVSSAPRAAMTSRGGSSTGKMQSDMDEHGEMKQDALTVAAQAYGSSACGSS